MRFSLHRISVDSDAEVAQLNLGGSPPLFPRATIGALIPNPPGATKYIFVVKGMMLHCVLICVLLCSYG